MSSRAMDIQGFLVDITGVLYESGGNGTLIPGSDEAVRRLYELGKVKFLSNQSTKTTEVVVERMNAIGFDLKPSDVICTAPVAAAFLEANELRPHLMVHQGVQPCFNGFPTVEPNCIVMGDAEHTFHELNAGFKHLMNMKHPIVVSLGDGKFYQRSGEPVLGVGAFVASMKSAVSNLRHIVIGKPSPEYFQAGLDALGLPAEKVAMIGDDITSDVGGAMDFGMHGVLVRTGKFRPEWDSHPTITPSLIANDLLHAVETLLSNHKYN